MKRMVFLSFVLFLSVFLFFSCINVEDSGGDSDNKDTIAPTITVMSPTNGEIVYGDSTYVSGTARDNDNGSGVKAVYVAVDNSGFSEAVFDPQGTETEKSWTFQTSTLLDGNHIIYVYAIDYANNSSETNEINITITTSEP